ncbi:glycosyl hydrolase family 28-related protein [Crateriforma spongiae]|uniref:glycosyl hydrolase family 28-related protein n=1 Tax=Crateriforma spongiae TaxID=2724528 RepID=UPI0039AFB8B6
MSVRKNSRAAYSFAALTILMLNFAYGELPHGFDRSDPAYKLGLLDVTKFPYTADPTGEQDSTDAIQRAINDARDNWLVCYFPEGTYLISDTISCEQQVEKLDRPRTSDGRTQHYWDRPHRIILFGSGKGERPVIKLAESAKGFDDPNQPKHAIKIWAQTRHDAPGIQEPNWGEEQPNIAFNHYFKGIDIDIRGHSGAIGLRFSGAQGSSLLDCTVHAEGAFAGFSDCPGQGGGTYNIETIGGRYGITIDSISRFPLLVGCRFVKQSVASIGYHTSTQVPTLLVGCQLAPDSPMAVDLTRRSSYAGVNLVDCRITTNAGGFVVKANKTENVHLKNCFVRGAKAVTTDGSEFPSSEWTQVKQFSSTNRRGVHLINGTMSTDPVQRYESIADAPAGEALCAKHYRAVPYLDQDGVVNVKDFGAKGDGMTDDTEAFRKAIAAGNHVFVPRGTFLLSGEIHLRERTHLFGLTSTHTNLGHRLARAERQQQPAADFSIITPDQADASPGLSHLGIHGNVDWRSGKGTMMLAGRFPQSISGNGGGRFYGIRGIGRQNIIEGLRNPVSLYALNIERVGKNPQSLFKDCRHLRVYYFKVEAGTLNRGGDANTPSRIESCQDFRIHCMYGNVRKLQDRPMLEVVNSGDVVVSQLKAFQPSTFPHLVVTHDSERITVPSTKTVALLVRDELENDDTEK